MLSRRDLVILERLLGTKLNIKLLAEEYGISERNIRYIVKNINFYLHKFGHQKIEIKNGVLFLNINETELEKFYEAITDEIYSYSKEERKEYILVRFLFTNRTTILDLEKELHCSRPTIKKDLLCLENYLKKYELQFFYQNNKIFIGGNEKKYRHLKFLLYRKNRKNILNQRKENMIIQNYKREYFYNFNSIFFEIEKELSIVFDMKFKKMMNDYLTITLERIKNNHIIIRKDNEMFLAKLDEYKVIEKCFSHVINSELKYELLHLTEYFLSGYYNERFSEDMIKIEKFTTRFVLDLKESLDINLNQKFVDGILKYLIPAIYRIKNNLIIENESIVVNENIFNVVDSIVNKNNKYLKEPLRVSEKIWLTTYVERFYNNSNKISLEKLLEIIRKYGNNEDDLSAELIKVYSNYIEDDRNVFSNGLLDILKINTIKKLNNKNLSLKDAVEIGIEMLYQTNCIYSKENINFKEIAYKYGEYCFFDKKILLLCEKDTKNCIHTGITLIINENMKINENMTADILFLLSSKNKIEHILCISDIMKLINNEKIYEIIHMSEQEILTFCQETLIKE